MVAARNTVLDMDIDQTVTCRVRFDVDAVFRSRAVGVDAPAPADKQRLRGDDRHGVTPVVIKGGILDGHVIAVTLAIRLEGTGDIDSVSTAVVARHAINHYVGRPADPQTV